MAHQRHRSGAFTRIELLVVGVILALLVGVLVPGMTQSKRSTQLTTCVNNLKQVILAELLWVNDNERGQLSWQYSTNQRGTLELVDGGKLFPHIRALSNELVSPTILTCPADNREAVKAIGGLADANLSYFMNIDATQFGGFLTPLNESQSHIVLGDRNITNSTQPRAGILSIAESNYKSLGWNSSMHNHGRKPSESTIGNVATIDAAVHTMMPTNLQRAFKNFVYADFTNRLALP